MTQPAPTHRAAVRHLKRADPVLGRVIDRVGACRFTPRQEGTHFDAVARAIIFQQLSGSAASTIHGRWQALYGGRTPLPTELIATPEDRLRSAGLSRPKIRYLRDLAERVEAREVEIGILHELGDDEVVAALTRVKGVGVWTAHMFLIFRLGRPNVLPVLDLGVQKAIKLAYGLRKMPSPDRVRRIGAAWAPYSTVASWYLWRSLELPKLTPVTRGR